MKEMPLPYDRLIEEINALEKMIERMNDSMARGADWLLTQMGPKGPIAHEENVSFNHKVTWGLYEAGRLGAVVRVLDWLVANARRGPAEYYFPHELPFGLQATENFITKLAEVTGKEKEAKQFIQEERSHRVLLRPLA